MKVSYNSPVVLSYSLLCILVLLVGPSFVLDYFSMQGSMSLNRPVNLFRLISHIAGHAGWDHLVGNLMFILLLGPIIEERYGSVRLFVMMLATALVTGLLTKFLFPGGLYGGSGIVFMYILLASLVNFRRGEVPLTFIFIAVLYIGKEIMLAFTPDNVSQFAHIVGGLCGAAFGFNHATGKTEIKK